MKKSNLFRSLVNHPRFIKSYATFRAIVLKLAPVIILAVIFAQIAVLVDQHNYQVDPATSFLQYTDFNVQNARVGEDVYFKVCRQHVSNIKYDGNLGIYIIANPDSKAPQRIKVYGQDIAGTINSDCENKVIRASDFRHEAGTYEMTFCVDFTVKYGYQKQVCKTSNRYRIYEQPTDLQSKIDDLQRQLAAAQAQLGATNGDISAQPDQSLAVPDGNPAQQSPTEPGKTAPTGGKSNTGVQPPTCALNILGAGVACGSDGVLRL